MLCPDGDGIGIGTTPKPKERAREAIPGGRNGGACALLSGSQSSWARGPSNLFLNAWMT